MADESSPQNDVATTNQRKRRYQIDQTEMLNAKKPTIISQKTDFTDLNIDCLEHIFGYLGPIDLLNVAELNTNTAEAAKIVYAREYADVEVKISIRYWIKADTSKPFTVFGSTIRINSLAGCQTFVDKFGALAKSWNIYFFMPNDSSVIEEWNGTLHSINKKCGNHLVELSLHHCEEVHFSKFQGSFEKVESLSLSFCHLGKYRCLKKWFPSLKRLTLLGYESMVFDEVYSDGRYVFGDATDFKIMVESSPQLDALTWMGKIDRSTLHSINKSQPLLKELEFDSCHWSRPFGYESGESDKKVLFKNVENFWVDVLDGDSLNLPLKFGRLDELTLEVKKQLDRDGEPLHDPESDEQHAVAVGWMDFIVENVKLTKLFLNMEGFNLSEDHLSKLANGLPNLIELEIIAEVTADAAVYVLLRCKSLKTLRIHLFDAEKYDDLRQIKLTGWVVVVDVGKQLVFTRNS